MTGGGHQGRVVGVVAGRPIGRRPPGCRDGSPAASAPRTSSARSTAATTRRGLDPLDRVDDGKDGDRTRPLPASTAATTRSKTAGGRQRARGVVDEHDLDVAPQRVEAGRDGLLAGRAAGHDRHEVAPITGRLERVGERVALAARGRDDRPPAPADRRRRGAGHDAGCCARRCRRTPWARRSQTCARSGGDDDDRDAGHGRRFAELRRRARPQSSWRGPRRG